MNSLAAKISDSEMQVMKVLWQENRSLTLKEIRKSLEKITNWERSTIKTLIYRLCEKGIIEAQKLDVYYYKPLISEQEYNEYATQQIIDKIYNGSAKNLVASLIDSKKLNKDDIQELRSLFRVEE